MAKKELEPIADIDIEEMEETPGSCRGNWSETAVECVGDEDNEMPPCFISEDVEDTDGSVILGCRSETLAKKAVKVKAQAEKKKPKAVNPEQEGV